ncbi:MAG: glycosyltransferase family 2 protein [Candidatus Hydrogenedentota bacterium]|nr:MAG: glycosyltransferase family 2 protein [Candidatus Hydrogenedentota bacterium]
MTAKLRKGLKLVESEGLVTTFRYCVSYLGHVLLNTRLLSVEDICYQRWRRGNVPSVAAFGAMGVEAVKFAYQPLISVIMPVFDVDPALLRRAVESVERQVYRNWELCIADDCSTRSDTKAELERLAGIGGRIRVSFLSRNHGIAGASNAALELAGGEFIALLDHDDELSADALFEAVKLLNEHPDTDMIYSDEDKLDERGRHIEAFLKPDWSPELLLSNMYTCHLGVYRKRLVDEIGGFREGFEGAQDYDLVLRLTEQTDKIRHVPKVLYHWCRAAGSTSVEYGTSVGGKSATASSVSALEDALRRREIEGRVEKGFFAGSYRVRPAIPDETFASVLVPTRDNVEQLRRCVESIVQKTSYPKYEIIIIDNQSIEDKTKDYLGSLEEDGRIRVIRYDADFNFSAMNNLAAESARGDYLVFLNNDAEVIEAGWLKAMLELMQIPGVAVVGAKLLYPDDTVQHAGVVLWHCGTAGHVHSRLPRDEHGYFGMADSIRNCSAVSGACMMVRREIFQKLGGFDVSYAVSYQDVDFCLRVQEAGHRVVYTPFALLYHYESASTGMRTDEREERLFREKWSNKVPVDRHYNPNFPSDRLNFRLR